MMFVAVLVFTGCQYPVNKYNVSIIGTWVSDYGETYEITSTSVANSGSNYISYAGNNLVVVMDDDNSGRLFIKYTRAYEKRTTDPAPDTGWAHVAASTTNPTEYWWKYTNNAPDVGKWYAIKYTDLTNTSVKLSGAAGTRTSCDTLEEAITEFTTAKGYFSWDSIVTRQ